MTSPNVYSCLYSKHKTQKRKVWQDGKLTISATGTVSLTAIKTNSVVGANTSTGQAVNNALDSVVISLSEVQRIKNGSISDLETEKFLVQIEGLYKNPISTSPRANSNTTSGSTNIDGRDANVSSTIGRPKKPTIASNRMQKLMSRKFKLPQKVMVRSPSQQANNSGGQCDFMKGRKRPLQPGEWARQCQMRVMSGNHIPNDNGNHIQNPPNHWNQRPNQNPPRNNNFISNNNNQQRNQHNPYNTNPTQNARNLNPQKEHQITSGQHHLLNPKNNPNILPPTQHQNSNSGIMGHQTIITSSSSEQAIQSRNPNLDVHQPNLYQNTNQMNKNDNQARPNNGQQPSRSGFTSNDFDPSSFYGNDDGDDDDDSDSDSDDTFEGNNNDCNQEMTNSHGEYQSRTNQPQALNFMDQQKNHNDHDYQGEYNGDDKDPHVMSTNQNDMPTNECTQSRLYPTNDDNDKPSSKRQQTSINGGNSNSFLSRSDLLKFFSNTANNNDNSNDDFCDNARNDGTIDEEKEGIEETTEQGNSQSQIDNDVSPSQQQKNSFLDSLLQSEAAVDGALSNPNSQGTSISRSSANHNSTSDTEWDKEPNYWDGNDCCDDDTTDEEDHDKYDNDDEQKEFADKNSNDPKKENECNATKANVTKEHDPQVQHPQQEGSLSPAPPHGPFTFDINIPSESDSSSSDEKDAS